MPDEIVVHFNSRDRGRLRVIAGPSIKGVLNFGNTERGKKERDDFAQKHGLELHEGRLPKDVTVKDASGNTLQEGQFDGGPGVCYWEGLHLVCW